MPNKYKIIQLDIPIIKFTHPTTGEVKENQVFCADILDLLVKDFFNRKNGPLTEEMTTNKTVEEVEVGYYVERLPNIFVLNYFLFGIISNEAPKYFVFR